MGVIISNLIISWHQNEMPLNIYGTKQNRKIKTNQFKNNQYYELTDNEDDTNLDDTNSKDVLI